MSSSHRYRQRAPDSISTPGMDGDYDYEPSSAADHIISSGAPDSKDRDAPPPPPGPSPPQRPPRLPQENKSSLSVNKEDPLLDLEQLEQLHKEAEKMKALGNKHMAAQEYTRAYNAYSSALQLSPVGPSSHVFLSNRAAALLSLKRYAAAATDARRAVALAPSFGKAHARLGQSLYFLKDYAGAVASYQQALEYEPDNQVTRTYLGKAQHKLTKQKERKARGEDVSVADESTMFMSQMSVATDPQAQAAVVQSNFSKMSKQIVKAVHHPHKMPPLEVDTNHMGDDASRLVSPLANPNTDDSNEMGDDPDFEHAVRIQQVANQYLASKRYKEAIEQYSAALFLVPDDPYLSPELHLGRAHALNGSRRHESARNDAMLAIKIQPTSEAFSTLAKSLFYMRDYHGAIQAFEQCMDLLPPGESLSMFDQAYLRKAEAAWQEEIDENPEEAKSVLNAKSMTVPKLPPPRFVPREKAMNLTPNMPPMPKQWPQQSPLSPSSLVVGAERSVVFLSESLGIRLNRGSDGIVRVIAVTPDTPGSPVARTGTIQVGDVVREAAGVDIRRPITNIMWGDTVALVKMAPRPITLVVAEELSEVSPVVLEEIRDSTMQGRPNSMSPASLSVYRGEEKSEEVVSIQLPSPASGTEAVANSVAMIDTQNRLTDSSEEREFVDGEVNENVDFVEQEDTPFPEEVIPRPPDEASVGQEARSSGSVLTETGSPQSGDKSNMEDTAMEQDPGAFIVKASEANEQCLSPLDMERKIIGGEILFEKSNLDAGVDAWSNLRWLSTAGTRQLRFCEVATKLTTGRKGLFWSGDQFVRRKLVIFDEPSLILVIRQPNAPKEVRSLLDLPDGAELTEEDATSSFWVAESVCDPKTCKLRLSSLTTITSVENVVVEMDDLRSRACFELITPTETIVLSASPPKLDADSSNPEMWSANGEMCIETIGLESALSNALFRSHMQEEGLSRQKDMAWKHQIILGTLHSYVVTGNQELLERAIRAALADESSVATDTTNCLRPQVIDERDESERTPLHYACSRRASAAVSSLIGAGANSSIPASHAELFPSHLSALMLDEKSLSTILSASYPMRPDPNALDAKGRTPMYLAAVAGKSVGGSSDAVALARCLSALQAWGGKMLVDEFSGQLHHPVSYLASRWRPDAMSTVLAHMPHRYPLETTAAERRGMSLGALFHYPIHASLVTLKKKIEMASAGDRVPDFVGSDRCTDNPLVATLRVLLEHGFEPNERLEDIAETFDGAQDLKEFRGYTPLQILAAAALRMETSVGAAVEQRIRRWIAGTAELLLRHGGRLSVDAPPATRLTRSTSTVSSASTNSAPGDDSLVRSSLKNIESNDALVALLGGAERLVAATVYWSKISPVRIPSSQLLYKDKAIKSLSDAPGGSDEKSCAICWKVFGSLRNRKHRCRVSNRHICEDCSTKRIVQDGDEYRVSDGQFLLARVEDTKSQLAAREEQARLREIKDEEEKLERSVRVAVKEEEERNRESLFGGMMEKASNYVFGEEEEEDQVGSLTNQMDETRNALNERGDKLNSLSEKTSKLKDSSAEFARLAKELNRRQKAGFW